MANLSNLGLDANVKEQGFFEVVPAGLYQIAISNDELKNTKDGAGKYLELTLQIIEGEHKGTEIVDRLNIINKSQTAQNIGQGKLKRICTLLNSPFPPKDTRCLWGKPLTAKLEVKEFESNKADENGELRMLKSNEVKGYSKTSKSPAQAASQTTAVNVGEWV